MRRLVDSLPLNKTLRKLAVLVVSSVALLVSVNFWTFRPTLIEQDFVRRVLNGKLDEAAEMLCNPASMMTINSALSFTAVDGSKCSIPVGKAEFYVLNEVRRKPREGIADYLLGRQRFQLCAIWKDNDGGSQVAPIYCTTRGAEVIINHVGVVK